MMVSSVPSLAARPDATPLCSDLPAARTPRERIRDPASVLCRQQGSTSPSTNEEMVAQLVSNGTVWSRSVVDSFYATDRALFVNGDGNHSLFLNVPFRQGPLHLSAPGIYGVALEGLQLEPGDSFLNVGSGTGYLSALAAGIIGTSAVHIGVELQPELVAHARAKLDSLGHTSVQLKCCNCFWLHPQGSMRFNKIYVGAGAGGSATFIWQMLQVRSARHGAPSAPSALVWKVWRRHWEPRSRIFRICWRILATFLCHCRTTVAISSTWSQNWT